MSRTRVLPAGRSRHLSVFSVLLAVGTLVLSACGGASGGEAKAAGGSEPISIGVLLPYTGPFGLYGKPMEAALRARFAKADNKVDGHPIKLVFEDEATDAGTAVSKATKLIDSDHVSAIVCCATGAATLAVGPILAERGIPQLGPIPNPSGLSKFATAAVAAPTAGHDATALGQYAASRLHYKTAVVVASDFSYGHEVADGFTSGFTKAGGHVVKTIMAPLGTNDFGSYLSQVGTADVTFGGFAGADAVRFVQQYNTFGLKSRIPLIGHGPMVTELVLNQIGDAAVGVGAAFYYSSTLDNPANKEFLAAMKATGQPIVPSHFTAGAWASGSVLIDAVHRAGDKATDGKALAKAIRSSHIQAPWGELKFGSDGYAIAPTYYYEVTKDGGTLHHKIVGTIP